MSTFPADNLCECCGIDDAEIWVEGDWLCPECELEASEETNLISGLELATIYWGCDAKIIQGGQS